MDQDILKTELETYQRELPTLLANEGRFVVVQGNTVEGVYESYSDALALGYKKFGLRPFLVKKIAATEVASFITRLSTPCHA
jgi:hypothetical protein